MTPVLNWPTPRTVSQVRGSVGESRRPASSRKGPSVVRASFFGTTSTRAPRSSRRIATAGSRSMAAIRSRAVCPADTGWSTPDATCTSN
ncbi:hypothetical protein GCM10010504_40230 [Streptomyces griseus]|nr:hypothetical protein GCM10010504_40230 [Streptomyces griseus]